MVSLRPYEPPAIEPLEINSVGKHRVHDISVAPGFDEIIDTRQMLHEYGSPLFVVSEKVLRARYRSFLDTFSSAGVETRVAYSYKTNYLPAVCAVLQQEGALAEVVSGMEYELARSLGVPGRDIIFNGPYKTREEIEKAVADEALINIDGFDELKNVIQITRTMNRTARVGIRFNFRYGDDPWTKFGFSYENGDAARALKLISETPSLAFDALHNHCGTFNVDPRIYGRAAAVMIELAKRASQEGLTPTIADFGGGFPSGNTLKPAFDLPNSSEYRANGLVRYAEIILYRMGKAKDLFGGRPVLVLEPGRAIVDDAVQLMSTVVAVKDIRDQGTAVIIDAGVNILPTAYWYDHDAYLAAGPDANHSGVQKPVHIYGPLCMQIDVVKERASLPPLEVGTPLIIANVGAYCLTQSMQFIQTRPAVVMLGPDGPEVIRRREKWRDVFALDTVPARLHQPDHEF